MFRYSPTPIISNFHWDAINQLIENNWNHFLENCQGDITLAEETLASVQSLMDNPSLGIFVTFPEPAWYAVVNLVEIRFTHFVSLCEGDEIVANETLAEVRRLAE